MEAPKPRFVVAHAPFSPTVHLGARDAGGESTSGTAENPSAGVAGKAKATGAQQGYIKVPVTLKNKLPLGHDFHFKPQKKVVSLEKKKKDKLKTARPHQISYSIDKDKIDQQRRERERLKYREERAERERERAERKAKAPVVEHAVQTNFSESSKKVGSLATQTSLTQRERRGEEKSASTSKSVQIPFPRQADKGKKRPSSESKEQFMSKGGITVYRARSHRPQPFFKKAAASSSQTKEEDKPVTYLAPLAPKRMPIAPKLALREMKEMKEKKEKKASDELKRKAAVAELLQRVKEDIQKQHTKRCQEIESKVQQSTQKLTHVSGLLRDKPRVPLTPANLNKPKDVSHTSAVQASKTRAQGAPTTSKGRENVKARGKKSEKTLEELLDETAVDPESLPKKKGERDYPKPWQTFMKKPAAKPDAEAASEKKGEAAGGDTSVGAPKPDSASVLGDLYDILDDSGKDGEADDEKRAEILQFMKKKRADYARALKESQDKETEKKALMRSVHREYGEHSKQLAKDLVIHHKDVIAKAEERLKQRPGWVYDFAGVPYEDVSAEEEEEEGSADKAAEEEEGKGAEKEKKEEVAQAPKKAVKTIKIPKKLKKTEIKSAVKALATPPKPQKKESAVAETPAESPAKKKAIIKKKPATTKAKKAKGGKKAKGKKLSKLQKEIDELKGVQKMGKSALLTKLNEVATRLHSKLLALEEEGPAPEDNLLKYELEKMKLDEDTDAAEALRATEALHQQLTAQTEGGSAPTSPQKSPQRSPMTLRAVAEAMRATKALHEQMETANQSDWGSPKRSPIKAVKDAMRATRALHAQVEAVHQAASPQGSAQRSPVKAVVDAMRATKALHEQMEAIDQVDWSSPQRSPMKAVKDAMRATATLHDQVEAVYQAELTSSLWGEEAEEAMRATEALHDQMQVAMPFDSEDDSLKSQRSSLMQSPQSRQAATMSPSGSVIESIIEAGSIADYQVSPKDRVEADLVEADLVTNVVSLLVPSELEYKSPTFLSPKSQAQTPKTPKSPKSARKIQFQDDDLDRSPFDLRRRPLEDDDVDADVLPSRGDKHSIIDVYAKKNMKASPSPETPQEVPDQPKAAPSEPKEEETVAHGPTTSAEAASPKPGPPATQDLAGLSSEAVSVVVSQSQTQMDDILGRLEKLEKLDAEVPSASASPQPKASPVPSPKKKGKKAKKSPKHKESPKPSTGKIPVKIPTPATALAGQLNAELARFTSLSDMSDHLQKLEQKIEVVHLMSESQQASAAHQDKRALDESTGQIKELMNNIYEQQRDLTDEMKRAIETQSSAFVEKLRDTAAVQGNFYTETLKHTAKEMAAIMSNESSKSLEAICASFEEKLNEYTSVQRQMRDSLDNAAKSVEAMSRQQSPVAAGAGAPPLRSPPSIGRFTLQEDPSSIAPEYTQDFERATDSEAVSEVEEQVGGSHYGRPQASAVRSTKGHRDSGASAASESEVAEDIQVGGPSVGAATEEEESVEEEIMAEGGSPEAPGGPSAFPPAAPQVPDPEASKVSVSTDIEYAEEAHFSEAAASVTEEVVEISNDNEEEPEAMEVEDEGEGEGAMESFQTSSGVVLSLELPGEADQEVPEEVPEEEIPEEISKDFGADPEDDDIEEDISTFVFQEEAEPEAMEAEAEEGDASSALPPISGAQAPAAQDQGEDQGEDQDEDSGHGGEGQQVFVNINDMGYSMKYVDSVLDRVNLKDLARSMEEETDPIPTDNFFKIEDEAAGTTTDPEYIYHKVLFDAMNEVLLNRINLAPAGGANSSNISEMALDLEATKAEVKARVGAMVKFGLTNLDAGRELVKIHDLEVEEETKIFADFDKFFAETREDLVDGILGHILEDTITVLQESESGGKE